MNLLFLAHPFVLLPNQENAWDKDTALKNSYGVKVIHMVIYIPVDTNNTGDHCIHAFIAHR